MEIETVIKTEADAWAALRRWTEGQPTELLEFSDWPSLRVKISGAGYDSSLKSGQMAALLDFKKIMGRSFSAIAHGAYDARRLLRHEEEQLELTTKVEKGSSITDTDLTPLVNAIAQITTSHPQAAIGAALIIGLAFVARPIILKHFENKAKTIDSNERLKLIELTQSITTSDREKIALLDRGIAKLTQHYPQFPQLLPDASAAFWRLAASAANADKMEVSGISLSHDQLDALAERRNYRDAEIEQINSEFAIVGMIKLHKSYRVQLKSTTLQLSAIYSHPQMTEAKVKKLFNCMGSSTPIIAEIEIRTIDKSQVLGKLLSFQVKKIADLQTG